MTFKPEDMQFEKVSPTEEPKAGPEKVIYGEEARRQLEEALNEQGDQQEAA